MKKKKKAWDHFNSRENMVVQERQCSYDILQGLAENNIYIVFKM